ncbi:MAG: trypsin-like peptidase domain-containing protein [Chloroflexi bacterium]|nr:trypsin-like peptidase domain-containing protein [Chloroflexota bacterium]
MRNKLAISIVLVMIGLAVAACGLGRPIENPDASSNQTTNYNNNGQTQLVVYNGPQQDLLGQIDPTATPISEDVLIEAHAIEDVFINLYERINPSVVNIEVVADTSISNRISSSGSGFVYDDQGHIVTNAHVILDAREIVVTFSDGFVTSAELVGVDTFSDLGVIRVDVSNPERLVPVTLGDSNEVRVGQSVVAIGNPFGLKSSMTIGTVSATGRALPSEQLLNIDRGDPGIFNNPSIIQVDASINPGNSGGPVLNLDGEVIGVAAAIRTETGIFQGVAFAVPVNTLRRVVPQLIETGTVAYSYLGISSPSSDLGLTVAALAEPFNLPVNQGVLVVSVAEGTAAAEAGLQGGTETVTFRGENVQIGGDIIIAVNGQDVSDLDELLAYLVENTSPGDTITLTVVRGGETLEIPVVLGERPR